ncbi:MAG TPA: hypothetical protein EYP14_03450 [Planctomycetaceae bacterium]|nr:hypothetical protein [Planctomycetaceae bacterium]
MADFSKTRADRRISGESGASWEEADRILETDPLVRPIKAAAIQTDPFRIDHDQFPPPVTNIFAQEPPKPAPAPDTEPETVEGLVLKSTIIGVKQRAAFINGRLYFEGNTISWKGKRFRVQAIYPRRVVLTSGSETCELKIEEQTKASGLELQSEPLSQQ